MAKTYLDLVNNVLTRVREQTVGSVSASPYSSLISTYINDAKREVEDAWTWSVLWKEVSFDLIANQRDYDLSDSSLVGAGNEINERALLLHDPGSDRPLAWDITVANPTPLYEVYRHMVARRIALMPNVPTYPHPYFFSVNPTTDAMVVHLWEKPSEARTWKMVFKQPQEDLSAGTDTLAVPWLPVVLLATNYAVNERGEEVGEPGNLADQKYHEALANAIALDSRYSDGAKDFVANDYITQLDFPYFL